MTENSNTAGKADLPSVFDAVAPHGFRDIDHTWGEFMESALNETTLLRDILVYPGGRTSVHRHKHQSEIDIVMGGAVIVWLGTTVEMMQSQLIESGGLFLIPAGMYHAVGFARGERVSQPCARFYEIVHAFHSAKDIERCEPAKPGEPPANLSQVFDAGFIRDGSVLGMGARHSL